MRSEIICVVAALAPLILGASSSEKEPAYGNTPDELLPYRHFQTPYKNFFEEPQLFYGSGREKLPSQDLESVKIGFFAPIEGSPDALMGQQMLKGATLALEEGNKKGGYKGIPFVFVKRNDTGLWGASSNELVKLDEEKVWAVLGSIDGANTHIALRIALKMELPMVNTGTTDPTLTETRIPWIVRCIADDRQNGYALALYIFKEKGYTRVTVLRNNNRYGRTGIIEFKDAARRLGHPLLFELRYETGDTLFTPQLERIQKASAEAVVIWGNAREAGYIVKEMRGMEMEQAVFGSDRLVSPEFLRIAGEGAEGVVATHPYNPEEKDPYLVSFAQRFKERFGEKPESFAAHAYDGMTLLIEAIRKAGLNRARIRDALTDVKYFRGVTGEITFDATHNDVGSIWLALVRQGKFHFFPSPLEHEKSSSYYNGEKQN
jgi:ABC-type branched-subunit amino acid transport system substrate-binding protein